jgi:hypothetical protein
MLKSSLLNYAMTSSKNTYGSLFDTIVRVDYAETSEGQVIRIPSVHWVQRKELIKWIEMEI